MGLDVVAYANLKKLDCELNEDWEPVDKDGIPYEGEYIAINVNSDFPGRENNLENGEGYTYEETFHHRAGSYGGYNEWRETLSQLAGFSSASYVWDNCDSGPFFELICFSDCEGTMGPETCAKLYEDFKAFDEKAKTFSGRDTWFYEKYKDWTELFRVGSNGCVVFC